MKLFRNAAALAFVVATTMPVGAADYVNSGASSGFWLVGTDTLTNTAAGSIFTYARDAVLNDGGAARIVNDGSITGYFGNPGFGVLNRAVIDSLVNGPTGSIAAYIGVQNGDINATIRTLTNLGSITGPNYGVVNYGVITTLNNSQGAGSASGALTLYEKMPTFYNVIVNSRTSYGQLAVNGAAGATTFGIYAGSNVSKGLYASVLSGVSAANLSLTRGVSSSYSFALVPSSNAPTTWDLLVYGDYDNIVSAMTANATALRGVLDRRLGELALMSGYDCPVFDKTGVCVSFSGRYANVGSLDEGAGVMVGAYRFAEKARLGAFVDLRVREQALVGLRFSDAQPTFGLFAAYGDAAKGTGPQGKASFAVQNGNMTITRSGALADAEPGSGLASLKSYAVSAEWGWGFALSPMMVATPYAGLRQSQATRGGYSEAAVAGSVDYPISYEAFRQRLTTAIAGLRLAGAFNERFEYHASFGGEHDLARSTSAYSGASVIPGLESFALANAGAGHRSRAFASAGLDYKMGKARRLTTSIVMRGQAYGAQTAVTTMVGYQAGF